MSVIFYDFCTMHLLSFLFFELLKYHDIENIFLGNIGFNLTRSFICGSLAFYSYQNLNKIYEDKCLTNNDFNNEDTGDDFRIKVYELSSYIVIFAGIIIPILPKVSLLYSLQNITIFIPY